MSNISKKEKKWLKLIKIPKKYWQKKLKHGTKHYKVDAYDISTNTIYEFYGDYWHGNLNKYNKNMLNNHNKISFKELNKKTLKREKELIKLGYNLITIWESDFDQLLKNAKPLTKKKK